MAWTDTFNKYITDGKKTQQELLLMASSFKKYMDISEYDEIVALINSHFGV
jgi:hypothetical protein